MCTSNLPKENGSPSPSFVCYPGGWGMQNSLDRMSIQGKCSQGNRQNLSAFLACRWTSSSPLLCLRVPRTSSLNCSSTTLQNGCPWPRWRLTLGSGPILRGSCLPLPFSLFLDFCLCPLLGFLCIFVYVLGERRVVHDYAQLPFKGI